MMSNRFSVITLSAALGGLFGGLLSPAAYGHGNNPKSELSEDHSDPPPGGPDGPLRRRTPSPDSDEPIDAWEAPGPSWVPAGGELDPPGPSLEWLIWGEVTPIDPGADQEIVIVIVDIPPVGGQSDPSVLGSVSSGGAVPTPGTLALLGLAALTLKRRRRR